MVVRTAARDLGTIPEPDSTLRKAAQATILQKLRVLPHVPQKMESGEHKHFLSC